MALDSAAVRRLAHLARIAVDDETARSLGTDLAHILAMVDQLREVEADGIMPMAHPLDLRQRLREDAVNENPEPALYRENAPETSDGVYLVPKVIDHS